MEREPEAPDALRPKPAAEPMTVAAVDLGSNSFHMVIGRFIDHDLRIVDRLREPVRLAAGLTPDGHLSDEAQARALACLQRFGERLRDLPPGSVRAVGTNALRRAKKSDRFRELAKRALGRPVEVISGHEEARLIYLGVAHHHASTERRLVLDIGGGSTEAILGEGAEILSAHSLYVGCVTLGERYFPGGELSRPRFRAAETAALLELQTTRASLTALGWRAAVGASGTILAANEIAKQQGWAGDTITLEALKRLERAMVAAGHVSKLRLQGLRPDRAEVLPSGLSILIAAFQCLGIDAMSVSPGSLREGLLYDLVGRIRHEDVRDRTIRRMVDQYHVDLAQAARVERNALALFDQATWDDAALGRKLLVWASRLHEIGLTVSYTGHHKHAAYLVAASDMPGFSSDDQRSLAALIRGQRRKPTLPADSTTQTASSALADRELRRLAILFRIAVLLNRSRVSIPSPRLQLSGDGRELTLTFPPRWSHRHPLTAATLEDEAAQLRSIGVTLSVAEASRKNGPGKRGRG